LRIFDAKNVKHIRSPENFCLIDFIYFHVRWFI